MIFLVYLLLPLQITALYCSDILEKPEDYIISLEELRTMNDEEIDKCLPNLGKAKIPMENAKLVWDSLVSYYGGPELIPDEKLNTLHWITVAIEPKHYKNMTLSSIDAIENFGLFYDLTEAQLLAVAERVKEDWGGKTPEDYTSYDLIALRQILCVFDPSEILRIHVSAYRDAATAIGTLRKCPSNILKAFATLAMEEKAFGIPAKWKESTIRTIGVVIDGLSQEAMRTIHSDLVKKLTNKEE